MSDDDEKNTKLVEIAGWMADLYGNCSFASWAPAGRSEKKTGFSQKKRFQAIRAEFSIITAKCTIEASIKRLQLASF